MYPSQIQRKVKKMKRLNTESGIHSDQSLVLESFVELMMFILDLVPRFFTLVQPQDQQSPMFLISLDPKELSML